LESARKYDTAVLFRDRIGQELWDNKDYTQAIDVLEGARHLLHLHPLPSSEISEYFILDRLARVSLDQKNFSKAKEYSALELKLVKRPSATTEQQATAAWTAGSIYREAGDQLKARAALEEAVRLFDKTQVDARHIASLLAECINCADRRGDRKESLRYRTRHGRQIAKLYGENSQEYAEALWREGLGLRIVGSLRQSEDKLRQAIDTADGAKSSPLSRATLRLSYVIALQINNERIASTEHVAKLKRDLALLDPALVMMLEKPNGFADVAHALAVHNANGDNTIQSTIQQPPSARR
jgi:tetratricopeptide (TPR) repeat protein